MNTTVLAERLRAQFPDALVDIAQPRGELTLDVGVEVSWMTVAFWTLPGPPAPTMSTGFGLS